MSVVRLANENGRAADAVAVLCCVLLAVVAAALCVRLLWAVLPTDDAALAASPSAPAATAVAPPARSIAQWHLFGTAVADRRGAGPSTSSLILRGTLAENDPKAGLAMIADAGKPERSRRVGEEVSPGVRLAAVYADHVVVTRDGVEETLNLPRDTGLAPAAGTRTSPGSAAVAANAAPATPATPGTQRSAIRPGWEQTIEQLRRNPEELARRVRIVPVLDGARMTGVRVATGTDMALLNQIGLQQGDVVTSVNGVPVDSIERGQQIMSSLGNATSVRVTVLRAGKPTDVTVGLR